MTTPRPAAGASGPRRAFAENVLGTLATAIADRTARGEAVAARAGANAPAALVTLLWYPDRPIGFLADRLRISHPGATQLSERLERAGLVERVSGRDSRTRLLALTPDGEHAARATLAARRAVLARALSAVDDSAIPGFTEVVSAMLEALTDDLLTGEYMCRLCDELACPDSSCPVERAEPAPAHRRGAGYGVLDRPPAASTRPGS